MAEITLETLAHQIAELAREVKIVLDNTDGIPLLRTMIEQIGEEQRQERARVREELRVLREMLLRVDLSLVHVKEMLGRMG